MNTKEQIPDFDEEECRKYWIGEKGSMMKDYCEMSLGDLSVFLTIIDQSIAERELADIEEIKRHSKGQIDWADRYPYWWQDIVGTQIRHSFIISIMSITEHHLNNFCEQVHTITALPLPEDQKKRSWFEKSRHYLINIPAFTSPPHQIWDQLKGINILRNVFVHNGGVINCQKKDGQIRNLLKSAPGLSLDPSIPNIPEIKIEFCKFTLEVVSRFFAQLHKEYRKTCDSLSGELSQQAYPVGPRTAPPELSGVSLHKKRE